MSWILTELHITTNENKTNQNNHTRNQGWGPRGLASTSRTPQGQNFVAMASKTAGLRLGLDNVRPWLWLPGDLAVRR